jgi:hypothetical protein
MVEKWFFGFKQEGEKTRIRQSNGAQQLRGQARAHSRPDALVGDLA